MIIIIDGYNLLKQIIKRSFATDAERAKLLEMLRQYSNIKGHKIIIVFDGGPEKHVTYNKTNTIDQVFSGRLQSADDYIKNFVEGNTNRDMIVVTSDNELSRVARMRSIVTIDALAFYDKLVSANKKLPLSIKRSSGSAIKFEALDSDQDLNLDKLMQEASEIMMYKDVDNKVNKPKIVQKSSKHDRKLEQIIKKL